MEKPPLDRATSGSLHRGRVAATAIIWGCSTGMLAIDLLLSADAQSGAAIAVAIVAAAAASTMTIWLSTGKTASAPPEAPEHK